MSRRRLAVTLLACLLFALPQTASVSSEGAEEYLKRISSGERATYEARKLVVYFDEPQAAAVLETRSRPQGTFVRAESGSDVMRLWRTGPRGLVSGGAGGIADESLPSVPVQVDRVMSKYDVAVGAMGTLLGLSVVPLELRRRVDRKLVLRLWIHPETGIVYRRELFGPDGDLVGLATILDMRWGDSSPAEQRESEPEDLQVTPSGRGDAPARLAYGYRFVRAYDLGAEDRRVDHWVYSDGLHALSVFRTPGSMAPPARFRPLPGGVRLWEGPGPGTWAWQGGRATWTIVAEEPALDPEKLTSPFPVGGPSVVSRMGAWWSLGGRFVASLFGR